MRQAGPGSRLSAAAPDVQARRLRWRCRRGMKELDVILERFARAALALPPPERTTFERLLALPDPLLARYLLEGITPSEPQLARLVGSIRTYVAKQARVALFCSERAVIPPTDAELSGEATVYLSARHGGPSNGSSGRA